MPAYLYYLIALLFVLACGGAWLTNLVTLPGNWLLVALAALYAWQLRQAIAGNSD
jgi:uncharacterized protein